MARYRELRGGRREMMAPPDPWVPAALLVVIGIAFTARTIWLRRSLGRSPFVFTGSDSAHDHLGRVFRLIVAAAFVWVLARVAWKNLDNFAGALAWLVHPAAAWGGIAILGVGAVLIVAAQFQMGASWRIGVDRERTELVTHGLFGVSRNPVFLGMVLVLVGGFLVAPSAVTAGLLGVGWVAFSTQIRLEEAHLAALHGEAYAAYRAKVRRWI
jgi:protein-S-isoprenylcysteine O-methyltransferase Ste14